MNEFKKFISKGNVMEMAVGLIMATYFGAIIKSFVNDILMPPIGMMMGGVDFADMMMVLQEAVPESAEELWINWAIPHTFLFKAILSGKVFT